MQGDIKFHQLEDAGKKYYQTLIYGIDG